MQLQRVAIARALALKRRTVVEGLRDTFRLGMTTREFVDAAAQGPAGARLFESYGRKDAADLAQRLRCDLESSGFHVWQDVQQNMAGQNWDEVIEQEIRTSDAVIAILSPHATRTRGNATNPDDLDSICRAEIRFACFGAARPIIPVMAIACEPPLIICGLDYIDMTGWQTSEETYQNGLRRLVDGIAAALAGQPSPERPAVTTLEPFQFGAFLNDKRARFRGREWLFEEIESWRRRDDERALLITGDPGAGKSAIVAELVDRNTDGQVVAYYCCQADVPVTLSPGTFVRSIAAMLASQIPAYGVAISRGKPLDMLVGADADPESAIELGVIEPLSSLPAPPGPARYLLIDALDESLLRVRERDEKTILDLLSSRLQRFPPWLRVVATTRHERAVLDRFRGIRLKEIDARDPRNLADVAEYIRERLHEPELESLLRAQGADAAQVLDRLCALADGSFIYAKQTLVCVTSSTLRFEDLDHQPPGLTKLYDEFFRRTFPDEAHYAPTRQLLCVLLAGRSGLSGPQLAAVCHLSPVALELLLAPLSGYLSLVDGRYALYHKSLAEWLTDSSIGTTRFIIDAAAGEGPLLAYCRGWRTLDDTYPLRQFPAHLANAGEIDELKTLLLDKAFDDRRRRAKINTLAEVEDYRALTDALLMNDRADEVPALAATRSPTQRDGVAVALRDAGPSRDEAVARIVDTLLKTRSGADLEPEVLNGRQVGIRLAAERGYPDALRRAANDESATVRAMLVPYLYSFWKKRPEDGWALLDTLAQEFTGRFGKPREEMVEVVGGLALAIVSRDFADAAAMTRLGRYCRDIVAQSTSSPALRLFGRGVALKVAVAALTKALRDQPEYQPLNLSEIKRGFPLPPLARERSLIVLETLERPAGGYESIVDALHGPDVPFHVYLMLLAERALVFHGAEDPGGVLAAIGRIYRTGLPWFRQSCLYSACKILEAVPVADDAWLDALAEMTSDFVATTGATLSTEVATYSLSPCLAGLEFVVERHRPTGCARYLPGFFQTAMAADDYALAGRVIKSSHLLSLMGEPLIALDALRDVAAGSTKDAKLEAVLVEALANIRLHEDGSVDRFLAVHGSAELARRVTAATPTMTANEYPTMIDFFANHQLVHSDDARRELCGAFRRAIDAASASELIYDVIVWVLGLMN